MSLKKALRGIGAMAKAVKKKAAKSVSKPAPKAKLKAKAKPKVKAASKAPPKAKAAAKTKGTTKAPVAKNTEKEKSSKKSLAPSKKEQASSNVKSKKAAGSPSPEKRLPLGPIEPGRLGQKRGCLECGTKFYDFERTPITCPKCFSEFDPEDLEPKIVLKSDSKKTRVEEKEEEPERELVVSDSGEDFESLEDLSDDESAVVGIGPDKDSDESFD